MYGGLRVIAMAPVLDEALKIGSVVARTPRPLVDELLVIDDGSRDDSAEVARAGGACVLPLGRTVGVGAALRAGFRHAVDAGFDVVVVMAGNNKDSPEEIPLLLDPIADGRADFVQGSRFLKVNQGGPGSWGSGRAVVRARRARVQLATRHAAGDRPVGQAHASHPVEQLPTRGGPALRHAPRGLAGGGAPPDTRGQRARLPSLRHPGAPPGPGSRASRGSRSGREGALPDASPPSSRAPMARVRDGGLSGQRASGSRDGFVADLPSHHATAAGARGRRPASRSGRAIVTPMRPRAEGTRASGRRSSRTRSPVRSRRSAVAAPPIGRSVFVHPQALCESEDVGSGTRVWAFAHVMVGAHVGAGCNLGDHVFVETGAWIGDRVTVKNQVLVWDRVTLEDEVFVGPGVVFTNDLRPRVRFRTPPKDFLPTRVRPGASIGANATIRCGVTVGANAFVAAGGVVIRDVHPTPSWRATPPAGSAGCARVPRRSGRTSRAAAADDTGSRRPTVPASSPTAPTPDGPRCDAPAAGVRSGTALVRDVVAVVHGAHLSAAEGRRLEPGLQLRPGSGAEEVKLNDGPVEDRVAARLDDPNGAGADGGEAERDTLNAVAQDVRAGPDERSEEHRLGREADPATRRHRSPRRPHPADSPS